MHSPGFTGFKVFNSQHEEYEDEDDDDDDEEGRMADEWASASGRRGLGDRIRNDETGLTTFHRGRRRRRTQD